MVSAEVFAPFRLDDKVAVVTGGNRGLGEAFSRALADVGAHVAVAARDADRSEQVAAGIREDGGVAVAVELDVRDRASVERTEREVRELLGPADVLVNNAGIGYERAALKVPDEEWHDVYDVNVHGLWYCCQVFGNGMVERGGGVIVNVGSMSGFIVNRPNMQPAYNSSKAAVHHLTRSLAAEWAPFGVRVNAVAPGFHRTEIVDFDEPRLSNWWEDTPMLRFSSPEELAPTIVYLASDATRFMTGSVVVVDGGYTLW